MTWHKEITRFQYGLLADFLDGMLDACSRETTIVDAWESSYPYKQQRQFEQAYQTINKKALDWTAVPDKYRSQVKAGFGLWMDNDWRRKGWNLTDFSKNSFWLKECMRERWPTSFAASSRERFVRLLEEHFWHDPANATHSTCNFLRMMSSTE